MDLNNFINVDIFITEIDTDIGDLTEAMRTQTARTAFYGIQHSHAKKQKAKVVLTMKSVEAMLMKKYRTDLAAAAAEEVEGTNKAPTRPSVDMVKASVAVDPNMLKYLQLEIEADEIESICRVAYDAFRTRRDMLVSLGQLTRAQMAGNLTINNARNEARTVRERRAEREAERASQSTVDSAS